MTGTSTNLHHAVRIQRQHALDQWHIAMRQVPDEAKRECREYLRVMAERVRLAEKLQATRKFDSLPRNGKMF